MNNGSMETKVGVGEILIGPIETPARPEGSVIPTGFPLAYA